jgi:AcrR family transcriptional regulator
MGVGLREQKKQETREAIADAALRLFVERGFDAVTVAEIAEAARVSEKTVFNYFPTKEDLFFDHADEREAALLESLRERKPGESMLSALRRTAAASCERMGTAEFAGFARLIDQSAALQNKERQMFARFTQAVADELIREGAPEAEAWVASSAVAGAYACMFATARKRALSGQHGPDAVKVLRKETQRAFTLLEHGLGSFAPKR